MEKFVVAELYDCVHFDRLDYKICKKIEEEVLKNGLWAEELEDLNWIHDMQERINDFCDGRKIVFDKESGLPFDLYEEKYIEIEGPIGRSRCPQRCIVLKQYICLTYQDLPRDIKDKAQEKLMKNPIWKEDIGNMINDDFFVGEYCLGGDIVFDIETGTPFCLDNKKYSSIVIETQLIKKR